MPRVTIDAFGNYELEPPMLSTSTKLIAHVQALCDIVANAESEQELETIAAHVGDVVTKARTRLLNIAKTDQRLMSSASSRDPKPLEWRSEGDGEWSACSSFNYHGIAYLWRIGVCEDGTFDVNDTDSELSETGKKISTFSSLAEAKKHCQGRENEMVADFAAGLLGSDTDGETSFD